MSSGDVTVGALRVGGGGESSHPHALGPNSKRGSAG